MKKISVWLVALLTSLASLAAMCIFSVLLAVVYYFIGKVAFLSEIIDFVGELLDLGLTVLASMFIAITIWRFGHTVIEKISGKEIKYADSPIAYINSAYLFVFLVLLILLGVKFAMLIGGVVGAYTADFQGLSKILMFFKAIKDALLFVCNENRILYEICINALVLFGINIYAGKFID